MKKPLLIGLSLLSAGLITGIYAQTTTAGTSIMDKMKAVAHSFTLSSVLNPTDTGLTSDPVKGKKTGDILTAGEWNRVLELVSEGGGSGGTGSQVSSRAAAVRASGHPLNIPSGITDWPDSIVCDGYGGWAGGTEVLSLDLTGNNVVGYTQSEGIGVFFDPSTGVLTRADRVGACGASPGNIATICAAGRCVYGGGVSVAGGLSLYKCTNAQSQDSTNAPCYGASRNGGAGTNQYRVVSCTDNDGTRSYTMSSILNFGQLVANKWAVSVNGGTIECDDGTTLVMDIQGGGSPGSSGMASPIVKTKFKPTTGSSLTFDIPAGSRYATARILGNATGYSAIGDDENHEAMEIFFDFQNGKSSGIHNLVIGVGVNWSYGYTWEDHAFGTRVALKEGDDTLPAGYEIWSNGVRPTVTRTGNQLTISGLSNQYISQVWIVTFY